MSRRFPRAAALLTALLVLPLAACMGLPEDGPVVESGSQGAPDERSGIYIDPRPPQPGASAPDIVAGFLDAMTATPIQTNEAKQFLTRDAQAGWNPGDATITYAEALAPQGSTRVTVKLVGAEHLDSRGAYQGRLPAGRRTLTFPMAREDGEWRIDAAPDAFVVPETWFEQRFGQVSLYYFDPSGRILVPEPVFVPLGEQLATATTEALLRGPAPQLDGVSRTFIPSGLGFDLSVPVSAEGVAQLELSGYAGQLSPDASRLMLTQLAWTLRQVPGIDALRVTVGGRPVTLPGGASEVSVTEGATYDPTGLLASSQLFGLRDGRLVAGGPDALEPVEGPMGASQQGVRSVAVNLDASRVAGVGVDGDRLLVSSVRGPSEGVEQLVSGAANLLRPGWDFAGRLWLVDAAPDGARFSHLSGDEPQALRVPGLSGRRVTRFLVSRDGSRLVGVVRRPGGDAIMVSRIRHDAQGRVVGATRADQIAWEGESGLQIRDIGWSSPTSVAVLHRVARELHQVRTISVDGSPSGVDDLLTTLPGRILALAASPVDTEALYAVTATAIADPRGVNPGATLEEGTTQLGYVG